MEAKIGSWTPGYRVVEVSCEKCIGGYVMTDPNTRTVKRCDCDNPANRRDVLERWLGIAGLSSSEVEEAIDTKWREDLPKPRALVEWAVGALSGSAFWCARICGEPGCGKTFAALRMLRLLFEGVTNGNTTPYLRPRQALYMRSNEWCRLVMAARVGEMSKVTKMETQALEARLLIWDEAGSELEKHLDEIMVPILMRRAADKAATLVISNAVTSQEGLKRILGQREATKWEPGREVNGPLYSRMKRSIVIEPSATWDLR